MTAKSSRGCIVEGCADKHGAHGYCDRHYKRWRRYGDPTGGKDGTRHGEPHRYLAEVVRRWDSDLCCPWPYSKSDSGYPIIWLNGKMRRVTRVICEEEQGPPPTPAHEAAHSCGNGHDSCCNKRHLSWKTPAENQHDRIMHGTDNRGSKHGIAKLTIGKVREIRKLKGKVPRKELAAKFGVLPSTIGAVQRGVAWAWLPGADK